MDLVTLGMAGAFFILAAWLYETAQTIKRGDRLDPKFTGIYVIGVGILTYYSVLINDLPFLVLNSIIFVITLLELAMSLAKPKKSKRKP